MYDDPDSAWLLSEKGTKNLPKKIDDLASVPDAFNAMGVAMIIVSDYEAAKTPTGTRASIA